MEGCEQVEGIIKSLPVNSCGSLQRKELFLNTKGACFLCFKNFSSASTGTDDNDSSDKKTVLKVHSLWTISRYLNIDTSVILWSGLKGNLLCKNEEVEESQELYGGSACDFSVTLCEKCSVTTRKLSDLIRQIELANMLIKHHLQEFHHTLIVSAVKDEEPDKRRCLRSMKTEQTDEETVADMAPFETSLMDVVTHLRLETEEKCFIKLKNMTKKNMPVVSLNRAKLVIIDENTKISPQDKQVPTVLLSSVAQQYTASAGFQKQSQLLTPVNIATNKASLSTPVKLSSKNIRECAMPLENSKIFFSQLVENHFDKLPSSKRNNKGKCISQYRCRICQQHSNSNKMLHSKITVFKHLINVHPEAIFPQKQDKKLLDQESIKVESSANPPQKRVRFALPEATSSAETETLPPPTPNKSNPSRMAEPQNKSFVLNILTKYCKKVRCSEAVRKKYHRLFSFRCALCRHTPYDYRSIAGLRRHVVVMHTEKFFASKRPQNVPADTFQRLCRKVLQAEELGTRKKFNSGGTRKISCCQLCSINTINSSDRNYLRYHYVVEHYKVLENKLLAELEKGTLDDVDNKMRNTAANGMQSLPTTNSFAVRAKPKVIKKKTRQSIIRHLRSKSNTATASVPATTALPAPASHQEKVSDVSVQLKTSTKVNSAKQLASDIFAKYKPIRSNNNDMYHCPFCNEMRRHSCFRTHLINVHPEILFATTKLPNVSKKQFTKCCMQILKSIGVGKNIANVCELCSRAFSRSEHLRYHMVVEHYSKLKGKLIDSQKQLRQRKGIQLLTNKNIIQRKRSGQSNVVRKRNTTTTQHDGQWVCKKVGGSGGCGRSFTQNGGLWQHKKFHCPANRAYKGKGLGQNRHMIQASRKVKDHKSEKSIVDAKVKAGEGNEHVKKESGEVLINGKWTCSIASGGCGRGFYLVYRLRQHKRTCLKSRKVPAVTTPKTQTSILPTCVGGARTRDCGGESLKVLTDQEERANENQATISDVLLKQQGLMEESLPEEGKILIDKTDTDCKNGQNLGSHEKPEAMDGDTTKSLEREKRKVAKRQRKKPRRTRKPRKKIQKMNVSPTSQSENSINGVDETITTNVVQPKLVAVAIKDSSKEAGDVGDNQEATSSLNTEPQTKNPELRDINSIQVETITGKESPPKPVMKKPVDIMKLKMCLDQLKLPVNIKNTTQKCKESTCSGNDSSGSPNETGTVLPITNSNNSIITTCLPSLPRQMEIEHGQKFENCIPPEISTEPIPSNPGVSVSPEKSLVSGPPKSQQEVHFCGKAWKVFL